MYPSATLPTRPATVASRDGSKQGPLAAYSTPLPKISKRGERVGKTKRGKGTKLMAFSDGSSIPLALHTESASPHEVSIVEATLESAFLKEKPARLVGDKAYESTPLDETLKEQGIEMIAPHRSNRKQVKTQDGRKLRRYKRR